MFAAICIAAFARATPDGPAEVLRPGQAYSAQLNAGQHRDYVVQLPSGQAAEVSLRQTGLHTIALRFAGGSTRPSFQVDAGKQAVQRVMLLPADAAAMRLSVTAKLGGAFEIALGPAHAATDADRRRAAAQMLLATANDLRRSAGSFEAGNIDRTAAAHAAQAYRDALATWQSVGDSCEVRRTLSGHARLLFALGDYAQAQAAARAALDAACDRNGDASVSAYQAEAERTLGASLAYQGDRLGAIAAQQRALSLYRKTGDERFQGVVLGNIVVDYSETGQKGKAFDAAAEALKLALATGDEPGVAFCRERLAAVLMGRGEYSRALEVFAQVFEDLRRTPYPMVENMAWSDLGNLYRESGEADEALSAYKRSEAAAVANKEPPAVAEALANQGDAELAAGRVDAAVKLYGQALQLGSAGGFARERAHSLRGLGLVALERADWNQAQTRFAAAREVAAAQGAQDEIIEIELAQGDLESRQRRFVAAQAHYARALNLARQTRALSKQPAALAALARTAQQTGDLGSAGRLIEQALDLVESERARLSNLHLRTSYFSSMRAYYQLYIDILMQLHRREPHAGHASAALLVAERARARSLQDQLTERGIDIHKGVDPALLARERDAEDDVHAAAYELERVSAAAGDERRELLQKALDAANVRLDTARARVRESSPRYADLMRPLRLDLDDVRRQLLDDDVSVLEYWLGDERSYVWSITRAGVDAQVLPARAAIEQPVAALRAALLARGSHPASVPMERLAEEDASADATVAAQARALQERILPAATRARLRAQIVVVADGDLQLLPFALLPFAQGPSARTAPGSTFVYLPSLATLRGLRALPRPTAATDALAIFADPVFRSDDARLHGHAGGALPEAGTMLSRAMTEAGIARLTRLPNTRREAQGIAALAPQGSLWLALDFAANRGAAVAARWDRFSLVHFATHALLNLRHPEMSGIVLSLYDADGNAQDGFLRANDIYNLRMPADLVVLSVCDSGVGRMQGSEGAYSLARAFFYAGTRRVVASLWPVDDRASAVLMEKFYRELLRKHASPQNALSTAQAEMRHDPRWASPYYWAGFVVHGDWR